MDVTQVHDKIYRIRTPFGGGGTVFLYLLKGNTTALVDTGTAQSPREVLEPALAELGLVLSDVDMILNTHAHLDHAGGNMAFRDASKALIHVHAADLFMAESTEAQVEFMTAPLRALEFPAEMVQKRIEVVREQAGEAAGADVILNDGDIVDLGGMRLKVIHCPGHTPGSIAYYWESEGVLLTGDCILGMGSRLGAYPLYFDAASYRRTVAAAAQIDFQLLCLGHAYLGGLVNEPTRGGSEGKVFIREAARVADTIQRAVEEVVERKPGATRREIALTALSELVYQLPTQLVRETRMPAAAGPTLAAHVEAALSHCYPWDTR